MAALPPAGAGAAKPSPYEDLVIYLPRAHEHANRNVLGFEVMPGRGVAVAYTDESDREIANDRGVAYAVRIPKALPGGRLDVRFPGLGRLVGRVSLQGTGRSWPGCGTRNSEGGRFIGRIEFRGAGGYGRWTGRRASVSRFCGLPYVTMPKTLPGYLDDLGPGFHAGSDGPFSFLQASDPRGHGTGVLFIAGIYGRGPEEDIDFAVYDYEWLGGGVAAMRWASREGVPRGDLFEIAPGGQRPASATIRPPAPFSGEATYSRKDRSLTGNLSVHLLGRAVRIAGKSTGAFLSNSF